MRTITFYATYCLLTLAFVLRLMSTSVLPPSPFLHFYQQILLYYALYF